MAADLITVNGFTFCSEHGDEVCYRCTYDFRDQNNYSIQDELDEQISELLSDDRPFTFNIYHLGAKQASDGIDPPCSKHNPNDCPTCFNWAALITTEIQREIQQKIKDEKWLRKRQKYFEKCD